MRTSDQSDQSDSNSLSSCQIGRNLAATAMLDTVTAKLACPLRSRLPGRQKVSLVPGMKVWVDGSSEILEKAEFSLPKLLFRHNGRLLASQSDIDVSLNKCADILSTI